MVGVGFVLVFGFGYCLCLCCVSDLPRALGLTRIRAVAHGSHGKAGIKTSFIQKFYKFN